MHVSMTDVYLERSLRIWKYAQNVDLRGGKLTSIIKKFIMEFLRRYCGIFLYCPIIPRLERMFGSLEMAKQLTWHATHQN